MNISWIRRLASQGDMSEETLRYLLNCQGECEYLDYKERIDLENDHGCSSFSRDVLGMNNVGGGYLVIGVRDETWEQLGLESRLPYDTKKLRDKVRKCTGLDLEVDIVQREIYVGGATKLFGLILVRSRMGTSKIRQAAVPSNDFKPFERWGIRRGDIYLRYGDSTKRAEAGELNNWLEELTSRYEEEELEQANTPPSPFAVEQGLYRLLPHEYGTFVGREQYKEELRQAIESDPRIWIVNLFGPGGVGKSALATWLAYYYYRESDFFESILHLSAKNLELSTEGGLRRLSPTLYSLEDFLDRVLRLFDVYSDEELQRADTEEQKNMVMEILVAYRVLLVLDNMETIDDGRLMEFVRSLPPESKSKFLLTSRLRTAGWEHPIRVTELDEPEVEQFLRVRSAEMGVNLPVEDPTFVRKIKEMSGGLPLAIQWILGEYRKTNRLNKILSRALTRDSPLLEFSFRNSWKSLEESAQQALAVLSIFVDPPSAQVWRTSLDWSVDKMDNAITSLVETTFVSAHTEPSSGKVVYTALPITLTFARNELSKMRDFEREARLRYQGYKNRLDLAAVEMSRYTDLFDHYEAQTDTQKKAIVLCRMAEGQAGRLGYEAADQYYKQAMEVEPRSVYALVSYGAFKAELGSVGEAIELLEKATQYCTKKTGFYVYFKLANVYDQVRDRKNVAKCLKKALRYQPTHVVARHRLGVALSRIGNNADAIVIFDKLIQEELSRPSGPTDSLAYAYKSKMTTLRREGRYQEATSVQQDAVRELGRHTHTAHLVTDLKQ